MLATIGLMVRESAMLRLMDSYRRRLSDSVDKHAQGGKRPTMHDVARAAGVSQSLVSIVFRGADGASDETRARVLAAADEIGYVRDERARTLRSSRPSSVGVAFQTRHAFHHTILDGLYAANADRGGADGVSPYELILSGVSAARSEKRAVADLVSFRCGALILLGADMDEGELLRLAGQIPVVLLARTAEDPAIQWVASDEFGGVKLAVDHLVGLGHRRLLHVAASESSGGRARLDAFREQVDSLPDVDGRVVEGGSTEQDGALVARQLLVEAEAGIRELPTGIIAFNDRCALGMIDVFLRAGVRVPEDVSIVGYDDSEVAARYPIDMTSVRQEPGVLAAEAWRLAVALMAGGAEGGGAALPHGVTIPTSLTVRSTTGVPRA